MQTHLHCRLQVCLGFCLFAGPWVHKGKARRCHVQACLCAQPVFGNLGGHDDTVCTKVMFGFSREDPQLDESVLSIQMRIEL